MMDWLLSVDVVNALGTTSGFFLGFLFGRRLLIWRRRWQTS